MMQHDKRGGERKWHGGSCRSRDDKAEKYISRHMTSTSLSLKQEHARTGREQEWHVCLWWCCFDSFGMGVQGQNPDSGLLTKFTEKPRVTTTAAELACTMPVESESDASYSVPGRTTASREKAVHLLKSAPATAVAELLHLKNASSLSPLDALESQILTQRSTPPDAIIEPLLSKHTPRTGAL